MPLSGIEDITAPVVTDVAVSAAQVEVPGTLEVIVGGTDDVSGIESVNVTFYNTVKKKQLHTYLSKTYFDENTFQQIAYGDGKFHGTLEIGEYTCAGEFVIENIYITDKAGNGVYYYGAGSDSYEDQKVNNPDTVLPEVYAKVGFTVLNDGPEDFTAPTVTSITLGAASVTAPGSVEVILDGTDDVSGIGQAQVTFENRETDKQLNVFLSDTYYDETTHSTKEYEDGKFHGTLEISQYTGSGVYVIGNVHIQDKAENGHYLYGKGSALYEFFLQSFPENVLPENVANVSISVTNNGEADITPPQLKDIALGRERADVPAVIEVAADGTDDVSGIANIQVDFHNAKTEKQLHAYLEKNYYDAVTGEYVEYEDGKLHGEINIGAYTGSGDFVIEWVYLYDKAGNVRNLVGKGSSSYEYFDPEQQLPEALAGLSFYVHNDGKGVDVATSVDNPDLLDQISKAPEDAVIVLNCSPSKPTLPKEVFDAVKGTDKQISLVSESGIQWIFQRSDIVNESKDIDLNVQLSYITQGVSPDTEAIQGMVEDTNTVILQFPENGVLPGKAKIRVKVDYAMRKYLGMEEIYVYYFDNEAKELVPIAVSVTITPDYYIEFEIEHCSSYILTAGAVEAKASEPPKEDEPSKTPEEEGKEPPKAPDNNGQEKPGPQQSGIPSAGPGGESQPQAPKGPESPKSPKTGEDF